jgi:hypothetical protein
MKRGVLIGAQLLFLLLLFLMITIVWGTLRDRDPWGLWRDVLPTTAPAEAAPP